MPAFFGGRPFAHPVAIAPASRAFRRGQAAAYAGRFRLKARNGEIIATSEGYVAKAGCMNGIESVRKNAPDAEVVKEENN